MEKTLRVLNRMVKDGVIEQYAIGSAVAAIFYIEPINTNDLDIFFHVKDSSLDTLESLRAADLEKTVMIRGEEHTVVQAINRQVMHYSYHIGQIVFLVKYFRSSEWRSLSIPRNRSAEFNAYLEKQIDVGEKQHRFDAAANFVQKSEHKGS